MSLRTETKDQQQRLAAYCRTGEEPDLIGVTPGRLKNYRRLVFGVVSDALSSTYPLTVNLLSEKEWSSLCLNFFAKHACQDPQVWNMPFELIQFTEHSEPELCQKYPHLLELLLFEWKEVAYYMMPDQSFPATGGSDIWNDAWTLNPESEILTLSYPIHMKNARFISRTDRSQYFCLIYRNPNTFKVHFLNLSPFFAWLLGSMMSQPSSPNDLFPVMQSQFKLESSQETLKNITPFYQKLKEDCMIS